MPGTVGKGENVVRRVCEARGVRVLDVMAVRRVRQASIVGDRRAPVELRRWLELVVVAVLERGRIRDLKVGDVR